MPPQAVGLGSRGAFAQSVGLGEREMLSGDIYNEILQGGTLKTWTYPSMDVERVQVALSSEGRPFDADIELWHGPSNIPSKLRVHSEDGRMRPFNVVFETPNAPNTIAIRNIAQMEFPLAASLIANDVEQPISDVAATSRIVQGGAVRTYPFDANVQRVEVVVQSQGYPVSARIELLQGPNTNKQVVELYSEDALARPFFFIFDTIGHGSVVRVVNAGPLEFPILASVQPYYVDGVLGMEPILGGDADPVPPPVTGGGPPVTGGGDDQFFTDSGW
jgi:hypothetical protein